LKSLLNVQHYEVPYQQRLNFRPKMRGTNFCSDGYICSICWEATMSPLHKMAAAIAFFYLLYVKNLPVYNCV